MQTTKNLNLASYIEHTLLKPEATQQQIEQLCEEALKYSFKGVCVNSRFVSFVHSKLNGSAVLTVAVIGFPLGACLTDAKSHEAHLAAKTGAQELDMVINIGAIKENNWGFVEKDILAVTQSVKIPVKVILETGLLTDAEIVLACKAAETAGARFVKTSTGFGPGGATPEHIKLMHSTVSPQVGVKASGGIKSVEQAWTLIANGATRLGTSSGVQLVTGQPMNPKTY